MTSLLLDIPALHADAHGDGVGEGLGVAGGSEEDLPLQDPKLEIKTQIEELTSRIEEVEQQVNDVIQSRASMSKGKILPGKGGLNSKDRDREKNALNAKKNQQTDAARREAATSKRMAELMRQFGNSLRQITSHKWAWPFMKPVDVEGLKLHDYYDVIKKPMDLGTIRNRMEAKDGTGYRHVQEICDDVRLVFSNAMTYNQEGTDVHVMAKTLSEKFEDKWKSLEPKVIEEDAKRRQEEKEAHIRDLESLQMAEEAALEKHASDLNHQLDELNTQLEVLRQEVAPQCRMMTTEEKRQLGQSLSHLSPEDLHKAIQLIAQKNPDFKASGEEVEVDIDAQDASTLWRLQHFVRAVMISQNKSMASKSFGGKIRRVNVGSEAVGKGKKRSRKASP
ncbi:hypothetical protein GOP47_0028733 [Adiantum capillus-veneris]|nr:hypothetical protein GOP47_0030987 [Adiantum capillus-veneris]KAI5056437.1 hypothetical protein GOP47_0028255 [Adiantum capillus-veneris]KAI5056915.1 hypothetical protein GOP47_0028733 [Adiantum capillus-veneris]